MVRKELSAIASKNMASKSASGFAGDFTQQRYIAPSVVKINDRDALKLYRGNEWLQAVVNRIVDDCAKVHPRVVPKDKSKKLKRATERRIEEVQKLLDDPNENKESFREIREKFIRDKLIYGRGCLEKVVTKQSRKIVEVYAAMTRKVKVKVDKHGMLPETRAYQMIDDETGNKIYFDKDEMIFSVLLPTTETVYGFKKIDALANSVASDILRCAYNSNFFVNGSEASGIISLDGMSKTQLKKFRQYWGKAHKGARNAHKVAAVNVPVKWVRMALTNRDLEFSEYGKEIRTKIFAVYGMQPLVMGVVDSSTGRLNSEQQVQAYKDGALKPILSKESYVYTKEIIEQGFGYNDIMVDFLEVDLADAVNQSKIDRDDLQAGILTINEIRSRRGLIPVKWGDTPLMILPGGGQIDPDTGRLVMPGDEEGNESSDDEKDIDKVLKPFKGFFVMKAVDEEEIHDGEIEAIIGEFAKSYEQERYLEYLGLQLEQAVQDGCGISQIDRITEISKGSVYYYNCA